MNSRLAAYKALFGCFYRNMWSSYAIDSVCPEGSDKRDVSLCSRITLGVLQNRSLLDFYIDYFSDKGIRLENSVRLILETGIYQLVFLKRLPAHAVINETVSLCDELKLKRAKGYVNAVLRSVLRNIGSLPEPCMTDTTETLSVRYSHPQWLCSKLCDIYGAEDAEAFFRENNLIPGNSIHVNTLKISTAGYLDLLNENGIEFTMSPYFESCVHVSDCAITELPGYSEGLFYVQDEAARFAAELSGAFPGSDVLDVCASPGGKSVAAAIKMQNRGRIVSCDVSKKKLVAINENAARLGIGIISPSVRDGRVYDSGFGNGFDSVICDVPCSGIGVIRKRPEIRYKDYDEISRLPAVQSAIISNAASYVRPGGTLVYSTCTVLLEENEDVVNAFLKTHESFELCPFDVFGKLCDGMHTFLPQNEGTDGFFAAKMIRKNQL